jgi:hypothetical protein
MLDTARDAFPRVDERPVEIEEKVHIGWEYCAA